MRLLVLVEACDWFVYLNLYFRSFQFEEQQLLWSPYSSDNASSLPPPFAFAASSLWATDPHIFLCLHGCPQCRPSSECAFFNMEYYHQGRATEVPANWSPSRWVCLWADWSGVAFAAEHLERCKGAAEFVRSIWTESTRLKIVFMWLYYKRLQEVIWKYKWMIDPRWSLESAASISLTQIPLQSINQSINQSMILLYLHAIDERPTYCTLFLGLLMLDPCWLSVRKPNSTSTSNVLNCYLRIANRNLNTSLAKLWIDSVHTLKFWITNHQRWSDTDWEENIYFGFIIWLLARC